MAKHWLASLAERAAQNEAFWVGIMSGTSADAVDAVVVSIRGSARSTHVRSTHVREFAMASIPYPLRVRERLLKTFSRNTDAAELCALNFEVGESFAAAACEAIRQAGLAPHDIVAIGSHGQTVWHAPPSAGSEVPSTLQLGEPSVIAARTGAAVVSSFRAADMAAGGEGAPLVPYVDWLLYTSAEVGRVIQNIGGIANVTYLAPGATPNDVIAFDTGPGNCLIDATVSAVTGGSQTFDLDGAIAKSGRASDEIVASRLGDAYFALAPPKSTGRELFSADYANAIIEEGRRRSLSDADLVATVTELTARSIADAYRRFLAHRGSVDEVYVAGGGARNPELMHRLRLALIDSGIVADAQSPSDIGIRSESKEAVAFAVLARETLRGVPSNLSGVTGASFPVILGSVTPPQRRDGTGWRTS